MSFRVSITQIAPPWLLGTTGSALLRTFGTKLDDLMTQLKNGIKARFPNSAPDDALQYIGNDRGLEQGPTETADSFRARLNASLDTTKNKGGARTLLAQIAAYFSGSSTPPIRLVSNSGVWHEYDWTTGAVTKTKCSNWNWDGNAAKWWRGWLVIDGSSFGWSLWTSGSGVALDAGHVMGSTAAEQEVLAIQRLVQRWKPANVYAARIIVTFISGLFVSTPTHGRGPLHAPKYRMFQLTDSNPRGQYGDQQNFDANATYWLGGGEEP